MTIIELPDHNLSNSAARRSKFWMKVLAGVDTSKSDGYAFLGAFATHGDTIEVADGTWVMGYVEDVRASGRMDGRDVTLFQVRDGKLVKVEAWTLDESRGWALKIRDEIAALMATPAEVSADELLAEREQLLARLAEIDALLPEPEGTEVDTRHAAHVLGVSVRTVQRWAATGRVNAVKDAASRWVVTITINA